MKKQHSTAITETTTLISANTAKKHKTLFTVLGEVLEEQFYVASHSRIGQTKSAKPVELSTLLHKAIAAALESSYQDCINIGNDFKKLSKHYSAELKDYFQTPLHLSQDYRVSQTILNAHIGAKLIAHYFLIQELRDRNLLLLAEVKTDKTKYRKVNIANLSDIKLIQIITSTGSNSDKRYYARISSPKIAITQRDQTRSIIVAKKANYQTHGEVSYYAGEQEWEGWNKAGLISQDVIYVSTATSIPIEALRGVFVGWTVKQSPEGRFQIISKEGNLAKTLLSEWLEENNILHSGVRIANNVKRRDLNKLDKEFLDEVVRHNTEYVTKQIYRKHRSYIDQITPDSSDIPSLAVEIVLELAASFDTTKGVPFTAYVGTRLPNKLNDLARAISGRNLTDFSSKVKKMIDANPLAENDAVLAAELLGMPVDKYRRKLKELQDLRNIQKPYAIEIEPKPGSEENWSNVLDTLRNSEDAGYTIEEALIIEEEKTQIKTAIHKIAEKFYITIPTTDENVLNAEIDYSKMAINGKPPTVRQLKRIEQILTGMKASHLRHWEENNLQEIAEKLRHSPAKVKAGEERYHSELRKYLSIT